MLHYLLNTKKKTEIIWYCVNKKKTAMKCFNVKIIKIYSCSIGFYGLKFNKSLGYYLASQCNLVHGLLIIIKFKECWHVVYLPSLYIYYNNLK